MPTDLQGNYLHQAVQAIVTVLAVINPVVCGSIFLTLTPRLSPSQKRRAAVKVALSILIILAVSALIGLKLLAIFGISLDVFRIVGGLIIAYMGFDMLRGHQTVRQSRLAMRAKLPLRQGGPLNLSPIGRHQELVVS